mmetsp:Transcript_39767/g.61139  ORF Transcript_39767/g.61139 Transcript_39767/m.61139 type:complete len:310 (-) Transcript_39767:58-987(-)
MPHQQVAVQSEPAVVSWRRPVVIVWRTPAVPLPPVGVVTPDAHDKDRLVLGANYLLALLWRGIGVCTRNFIRGREVDFLRKDGSVAELARCFLFGLVHRAVDAADDLFQSFDIPGLWRDAHLPIKLVHVKRVQVVHVIVAAQPAEIGHEPLPLGEVVVEQCPALPLGKREWDLEREVAEVARREGRWSLYAVEVVVEAAGLVNEERCTHPDQISLLLQLRLEPSLDVIEGLFQLKLVSNQRRICSILNVLREKAGHIHFLTTSQRGDPPIWASTPQCVVRHKVCSGKREKCCETDHRPHCSATCCFITL